MKFFENNHKCVPFGLFITKINLLSLLIFFLLLAVFRFILNNNSILNDIKYQLCYLKRCLYTQKLYLFIVTSFFLLLLVYVLKQRYILPSLKSVNTWNRSPFWNAFGNFRPFKFIFSFVN